MVVLLFWGKCKGIGLTSGRRSLFRIELGQYNRGGNRMDTPIEIIEFSDYL